MVLKSEKPLFWLFSNFSKKFLRLFLLFLFKILDDKEFGICHFIVNFEIFMTRIFSYNGQVIIRNQPLKRLLPAKYDDNIETLRKSVTGADLPSARKISTAVETIERPKLPPVSEVTHMFTQWGQFIIHDIVHTPIIKGRGQHMKFSSLEF